MRRSFLVSGAALAYATVGMLLASAAVAAAVTPPALDTLGISQGRFPDYANIQGQFISGGESNGNIAELTNVENIDSVAFDENSVGTWTLGSGFEPTASGFASGYTDDSLSLYSTALGSLDRARPAAKNLPSFSTANASDVTAVPLPAIGWLLGAALLGLIAVARPARLVADLPQASQASAEPRPHGEALKTQDPIKASESRRYGAYSGWPGELC